MVQIWYMDDEATDDQRLAHHLNPPQFLEIDELFYKTGVEYIKVRKKLGSLHIVPFDSTVEC